MSARHRAERSKLSHPATTPPPEAQVDDIRTPRRWRRRLAWIGAALAASAVALVALVIIGNRLGANLQFGEKRDFGATGQIIFERNCALCHGASGQGGSGPAFTPGGRLHPLTFAERVAMTGDPNGLNTMPNWERRGMSPQELRMVAAYTQILSGQQPEPSVTGVR